MKKLILIAFLFCAFSVKAQQKLVLNGSFELNNPIVDSLTGINCWSELYLKTDYDNALFFSNHFGDDYTTALFKLPCLVCSPSVLWGGGTRDGDFVLTLNGREELIILPLPPPLDSTYQIKQAKISLTLSEPLSEEKRYKLSFWIKDPPPEPNCMYVKNNYVNVGISNYNNQLGRHLITTNYGDSIWQEYTYVFETQDAEEYLTVTVGVNDTIDYGVFIDHFVLTETTEPLTTGINELNSNNKQLLKIVDILGKESKPSPNNVLFYIYSNGTVEKRLIIE